MRLVLLVLLELDLLGRTDQIPRLLEIEGLVKTARYGGTPCVRSDGHVLIPGWLDRRRDRRVPVGISVMIECTRGRVRSVLNDLSITGLGLTSCPSVAIGSELSVEMPNGRILTGLVAWSTGSNVGISFREPLAEADPVFRSILNLRRAARTDEPT